MKKFFCICCFFSIFLSCEEDKINILKNEIDILKEDISKLQSVISLQNSYYDQNKIVSAEIETTDNSDDWVITFADNTSIKLPDSIVESIVINDNTEECTIKLSNGQVLVFNRKEIIYPTGIVMLTQDIKFMKNTEVSIEFRINPSNAVFNYDVLSEDCQIEFDMAKKMSTYSYVTKPESFRLVRIEQSKDATGKVKEGQYKAYIRDNGGYDTYKFSTALVLSSIDKEGNDIQLSSSTIPIERKKDTGLPVVVINTENESEIKDKDNWIPAHMTIDGIGEFDNYEGTTGIRGRGNSTWTYPKKPFALKLDTKSEILGMPSHKRWVLLANYMDRTLMRNHIAFEISKRTGLEWTVRGQYVELVLNGTHLGNYYLCEHIKIDKNRVNIAEISETDLDEESITGGYLLEFDRYYDEVNKFRSAICDLPVMLKEPEEDVLQPEQFEYIKNYINKIEEILYTSDYVTSREYASYIADTTFIDWWFVMELTNNKEAANPGSCYYFKERSDLLKMGPVWDFDWGTFTSSTEFCAKDAMWFSKLFKDPAFVSKVKERWAKFKPSFEEVSLLMEKETARLAVSAELDDEMWSLDNSIDINGDERMSHHDAVLNYMKRNYDNRIKWLNNQIQLMR